MTRISVNCGSRSWTFDGDAATPLLDLLLANGAPVSYSCRRGECGQCAVNLMDGRPSAVDDARPLWQAGCLLSCNVAVRSPLTILVPHDPELDGIRILRSPAKVHAVEKLASDTVELTLRLPPSNEIRYLPGQYIRVSNREGTARSYSLSAGPAADRMLRMHIRRVDNGKFSQWLFERASINELVHVEGPQGRFFLRPDRDVKHSVFLATGTGIAPVWAILTSASPEQLSRLGAVSVYWGNRLRTDAYIIERLETLAERGWFRFKAVFSREAGARPGMAHVQDLMLAGHSSLSDAQVYACGNAAMIEAAREKALGVGLRADYFHSDPFTAS